MSRVTMFDVNFDNYDFLDLLAFMDERIRQRSHSYILTCNVDHLIKLRKDVEFQKVYSEAGAIVADGMPIIWASKMLRKPLKEKVSGSDLFAKLGEAFAKRQYKLFFLGSAEGIPELAIKNLKLSFPALNIVGYYSPSYGFEKKAEENEQIVQMLIKAQPDIVFVGVGAPKQEKWIYENYLAYQVPISIGVGATFDFLSGSVKRAPNIMQKTGFEWFWRLAQEPRRLWKRYLIHDSMFIVMLWMEWKKHFKLKREGTGVNNGLSKQNE
ncbi:WecB/TagA/CpsF family glycosyltransferase [Paenibacillus sp. HWE-109]|uniref:WecB/TagA/CpsF family glycosyltransferase n=1 Tax=Paenibacillus sp. HWE-109 TaxID=1306526 RepID=UPI001EDE024A|nr:WecB/TagA/CpsF family glycosyltransferase [Paenibacillus sp. HWE-109]UKS29212.1 WecB/TagA/CpsF family glycosyltransferase [Paenibacillus sp. HWE-109]